jgi:hypothetical protein
VLADSGEIISRRRVDLEYQRLINTGNILTCWYSYHYECGVKRVTRTYSEVDYSCVTKWYNLSPVAGRFAESVAAYSMAAEPEYTTNGILFRPVNLDGGTRCGLNSTSATVLTNNNNIVRLRAIVTSLAAGIFMRKGQGTDDGDVYLQDVATTRKAGLGYRITGSNSLKPSVENNVFVDGVEVELEFTAECASATGAFSAKKNGVPLTFDTTTIANMLYPAMSYVDCVGCSVSLARTPYNGYIKQTELFTL